MVDPIIARGTAPLSVLTIARYVSGQTTLMMMRSGPWLITHNCTSFISDDIAVTLVENKRGERLGLPSDRDVPLSQPF